MSSLARSLQLSKGDSRKGVKRSKLVAVVAKETVEAARVVRAELSDRALHPLQVWRGQQLSARAEDQAVLGIEPIHGDLFIEVPPGGSKDLAQNSGVEKEGWAGIEFEAVSLHGGGAATDNIPPFHNGDVDARPRQQNSSGQAARTGPDND